MRKYFIVMKASLKSNLKYRQEVVGRSFFMLMIMYIFICLWRAGYGEKDKICDYSYSQIVLYLLITETVALSKMNEISKKVSDEVKGGLVVYLLNKPYNYIMYQFFNEMGICLPKLVINFCAGYLMIILTVGTVATSILNLFFVFFSIILSIFVDFCFSVLIGILSFRFEDVSGINMIYQKINQIFGGLFIPLNFLPNWMRTIAQILPFSSIYSLPAELYINFNLDNIINVYKIQLTWSLIMSIVLIVSYKHNIKYLSVNGG